MRIQPIVYRIITIIYIVAVLFCLLLITIPGVLSLQSVPLIRSMGFICLLALSPGAAWFIDFAFAQPLNRQELRSSPRNIGKILVRFFGQLALTIEPVHGPIVQRLKSLLPGWKKLFTLTILSAYFYVFMEWLFFVTKPSFMSIMSLSNKLEVFLLTGLMVSLISLAFIILYIVLELILAITRLPVITRFLIGVLPTMILSTLILLLIDNFTYTIFKFGISTATSISRAAYGILFILLFAYAFVRVRKYFGLPGKAQVISRPSNRVLFLAIGILILSFGMAIAKLDLSETAFAKAQAGPAGTVKYPNIILIGSDGVSADNMSLYGYPRDTTPRMRELAQTSLVAENAFSNSINTVGSITSIFTSKLPTQTRVVYSPDILTGINAYQHLPGLLKNAGYEAIEFGVPDYVDAFSLNLLFGFDSVNGVTRDYSQMGPFEHGLGYGDDFYFLDKLTSRAFDRIQHIFFFKDMQNAYQIVTQPVNASSDQQKIQQTIDAVKQTKEPVFIHVHLLGTHGAQFYPLIRLYSKGEQQPDYWMTDFYDDAILSYDYYVGKLIDGLKAEGEYDNTILIIYSDHTMGYGVNARVPLIIHFPGDRYSGRISQNVENLDIAPTVLDYLQLGVPSWMEGKSLLDGNLDPNRLIFAAGTLKAMANAKGVFVLSPEAAQPPFYQFSIVNLIDCQRWYQINLSTFKLLSGDVKGYTSPCQSGDVLTDDEARQAISQRLAQDGFDISSLP